jgi:hypothetical protein
MRDVLFIGFTVNQQQHSHPSPTKHSDASSIALFGDSMDLVAAVRHATYFSLLVLTATPYLTTC